MTDGVEFSAADLAVLSDKPVPEASATPSTSPEPAPAAAPAPSPSPAAEPGKAAADGKDPQPRDDKGKFDTPEGDPANKLVPLPALQEERQRRKELQERLEAVERQRVADMAKLDERLRILQGAQHQPETPSVDQDPVGAIKRLDGTVQEVAQRLQAEEHHRALTARYQAAAGEFSAKTPDFQAAYAHLMNVRSAELAAAGVPPDQIPMWIQRGELNMAAQALQQGINPAERAYGIAKALGYRPAEAQPAAATPSPAPSSSPAPAQPDAAAQLATIAGGRDASASLAAAGGSPAAGTLTLETLLKMDDDEFARLDPKKWRAAMGG